MFNKILIANRGEIAVRIIKTAKRLGIKTVAVFSDADQHALHVALADEAVYLGPSPSRESYLVIDKVIEAAVKTGAQAIHPGYGFLSENAEFCRRCAKENIVFIGPPVSAIEAMGSKSAAKAIMEKANVPLVPGYHGDNQDIEFMHQQARDMGYPVLLKAAAGGGGKGMRQVWSDQEFVDQFNAAKREAMSSFGDDIMLVEKYLTAPRHVEIQVFCDQHNNAVFLYERDCSVQRRHQKVIEEAPAFNMTESVRQAMGEAAIKAAKAIGYQGAGTVEFLLDTDQSFYFMEMNTRLQVEHPVTEMITGQDLVEWQLRVAFGETLPLAQQDIPLNGHAFEARIYAEDPSNEFLPATGNLTFMSTPETSAHVRIDSGVRQGDDISVYYDPMIAKLVVWDENRERALQRLTTALREYRIEGLTTNIDFLYNVATAEAFKACQIDTGFIEKNHDAIFHNDSAGLQRDLPMAAAAVILSAQQHTHQTETSLWNQLTDWRLNLPATSQFTIAHEGVECMVNVQFKHTGYRDLHFSLTLEHPNFTLQFDDVNARMEQDFVIAQFDDHRRKVQTSKIDNQYTLFSDSGAFQFHVVEPDLGLGSAEGEMNALTAPMNGTVVAVLVNKGDAVEKGQPLIIMEAMKMEHTIKAGYDGNVDNVFYQVGDLVDGGAELLQISHIEDK